jgi:hypothetical protein
MVNQISPVSPAKAIRLECKSCYGLEDRRVKVNCISKICKLKDKSIISPLRRIKAHCMDCVETRDEVKKCTGKLLFEDRLCYLHPYRLGKSGRKGIPPSTTTHLFKKKLRAECVPGNAESNLIEK